MNGDETNEHELEAPGAVSSEQIRCITSCCGCEQLYQTNEQQKPILPHPAPG